MKTMTPSALCEEINKHSNYLDAVDMGFTKISKRKRAEHEQYIADLKTKLFAMTEPDEKLENLSDEEILANLFS